MRLLLPIDAKEKKIQGFLTNCHTLITLLALKALPDQKLIEVFHSNNFLLLI